MLDCVGHPYAVNPDKQLLAIARERNWEVLHFTKPVRLRDRMTLRTPILTGALALGGAIVLALIRGSRRGVTSPRARLKTVR